MTTATLPDHLNYLEACEDPAALTPKQGRMRIAEDVLSALDFKRFVATHMTYFNPIGSTHTGLSNLVAGADTGREMQDLLPANCNVCAMGAMFVAAIDRFDACTVQEFLDTDSPGGVESSEFKRLAKLLSRWFDPHVIHLIEAAFEHGKGDIKDAEIYREKYGRPMTEFDAAARMLHYAWEDGDVETWLNGREVEAGQAAAEYRMRSVMHNILDHDGDFNPRVHVVPARLPIPKRRKPTRFPMAV